MEYEKIDDKKENLIHKDSLIHKYSLDLAKYEEELNQENKHKKTFSEKLNSIKKVYFSSITKGSLRASIFCLLCVTFSTPVFTLAYSMKLSGVILTLVIYIISAFSTYWTLKLLMKTASKEQIYDYEDIVENFYNTRIVTLTRIMILINILGSIIAWDKYSKI